MSEKEPKCESCGAKDCQNIQTNLEGYSVCCCCRFDTLYDIFCYGCKVCSKNIEPELNDYYGVT